MGPRMRERVIMNQKFRFLLRRRMKIQRVHLCEVIGSTTAPMAIGHGRYRSQSGIWGEIKVVALLTVYLVMCKGAWFGGRMSG
jgi:hypothetical protein